MTAPLETGNQVAILGLDTSGPTGSVALVSAQSGDVRKWKGPAPHSELLATEVAALLSRFPEVQPSALAVIVGPGSFTGLRVGVAFARAYAYARELAAISIATDEALLRSVDPAALRDKTAAHFLSDAQGGSFFCSRWRMEKGPHGATGSIWRRTDVIRRLDTLGQTLEFLDTFGDSEPVRLGDAWPNEALGPEPAGRSASESSEHYVQTEVDLARVLRPGDWPLPPPQTWPQLLPLYLRLSAAEEKSGRKA